jgi:hypothetical protein
MDGRSRSSAKQTSQNSSINEVPHISLSRASWRARSGKNPLVATLSPRGRTRQRPGGGEVLGRRRRTGGHCVGGGGEPGSETEGREEREKREERDIKER